MKKLLCILTLMFIAIGINADFHDPNHTYDYDQSSIDPDYASALASEYRGDTFDYYAQGYASNSSGEEWNYFTAQATASIYANGYSGYVWGTSSLFMDISMSFTHESSANGYGSSGYAQAFAIA